MPGIITYIQRFVTGNKRKVMLMIIMLILIDNKWITLNFQKPFTAAMISLEVNLLVVIDGKYILCADEHSLIYKLLPPMFHKIIWHLLQKLSYHLIQMVLFYFHIWAFSFSCKVCRWDICVSRWFMMTPLSNNFSLFHKRYTFHDTFFMM